MYTTFGVYICNYLGLAVYSVALRACPPRWGEVRALDERGMCVGESRAWGKCERWMSGGLRVGESRAWGKCERWHCAWVRAPPSRALCVGCAWDVRGFALPQAGLCAWDARGMCVGSRSPHRGKRAGAKGYRQPTPTRAATSHLDKREHPGASTKDWNLFF